MIFLIDNLKMSLWPFPHGWLWKYWILSMLFLQSTNSAKRMVLKNHFMPKPFHYLRFDMTKIKLKDNILLPAGGKKNPFRMSVSVYGAITSSKHAYMCVVTLFCIDLTSLWLSTSTQFPNPGFFLWNDP